MPENPDYSPQPPPPPPVEKPPRLKIPQTTAVENPSIHQTLSAQNECTTDVQCKPDKG